MNYLTTQDKVSMNDIPQRKPITQKELQTNCGGWGRERKGGKGDNVLHITEVLNLAELKVCTCAYRSHTD